MHGTVHKVPHKTIKNNINQRFFPLFEEGSDNQATLILSEVKA